GARRNLRCFSELQSTTDFGQAALAGRGSELNVNRSFDRKIIAGFACALALLLAIEALLYRCTVNQAQTGRLVAQTHEILAAIQELILRLTDAETARRGFIMSGRERYLIHYSNAVERVTQVWRQLGELTRDNPGQQQ